MGAEIHQNDLRDVGGGPQVAMHSLLLHFSCFCVFCSFIQQIVAALINQHSSRSHAVALPSTMELFIGVYNKLHSIAGLHTVVRANRPVMSSQSSVALSSVSYISKSHISSHASNNCSYNSFIIILLWRWAIKVFKFRPGRQDYFTVWMRLIVEF